MPTALERFTVKFRVDPATNCWNWIAATDGHGYGKFYANPGHAKAHRWSYEHHRGPIPSGLQIDHLCRNRACVNPDHLDPVTPRVNTMRGFAVSALRARQTHCIHGHEFTPRNTILDKRGHRTCRSCRDQRSLAKYRAYGPMHVCAMCGKEFQRPDNRRAKPKFCSSPCSARAPHPGRRRSHCKHGHEYTPENTIIRSGGARRCRICRNAASKASKARRAAQ